MHTDAYPVDLGWPICTTCIATSCIVNFGAWPLAIRTKGGNPVKVLRVIGVHRETPFVLCTHQAETDEALVSLPIMLSSLRSRMVSMA